LIAIGDPLCLRTREGSKFLLHGNTFVFHFTIRNGWCC